MIDTMYLLAVILVGIILLIGWIKITQLENKQKMYGMVLEEFGRIIEPEKK